MTTIIPSCAILLAGLLALPGTQATAADTITTTTTTKAAENVSNGSLEKWDARFLRKAALCNLGAISMSEMALKRNLPADDRAFAEKMISEHKAARGELETLAKSKGVSVPTALNEDLQKKGQELGAKKDKDFPEAYMECQIDAHDDAVDLFDDASDDAKDADVRAFAVKMLPTLKSHLAEAKQLEKKY